MIDMNDWIEQVKKLLDVGDRHINFDPHPDTAQLFINYYNLPEAIYQAKEGGGAERENNRTMLTVLFPSKATWYEKAVPEGKLRVGQAAGYGKAKLRGKTADPEKMAAYVAQFLTMIAKTVPPNYTHSKPPIT